MTGFLEIYINWCPVKQSKFTLNQITDTFTEKKVYKIRDTVGSKESLCFYCLETPLFMSFLHLYHECLKIDGFLNEKL